MLKSALCIGLSLGFMSTGVLADKGVTEIDLMFWNTHNLFDADHDEGKDDWTYLPKGYPGKDEYCATVTNDRYRQECYESNWTNAHFLRKIDQLAKGVKATRAGQLPMLLGLCEVENDNVVNKLAKELGYRKFVMTSSPDKRGIDVALIYKEASNFKFVKKTEHVIAQRTTRNILEAEFNFGGQRLLVFVNHWPSQSAPSEVRMAVAEQLHDLVKARLKSDPKTHIIAMGDFNVILADHPHPFKSMLTDPDKRVHMLDAQALFKSSSAPSSVKKALPNGTYFYMTNMSWNQLDRFFVSENLTGGKGGLRVDEESYRILAHPQISTDFEYTNEDYFSYGTLIKNVPYRSNLYSTNSSDAGYSDHFPIYIKITR